MARDYTRPRARCTVCGLYRLLRMDGAIGRHGKRKMCPGSYQSPDTTPPPVRRVAGWAVPPKTAARCSRCRAAHLTAEDGTMRPHDRPSQRGWTACDGSGQFPLSPGNE
jgi:hypothetical protein